MAYEHLFQPIDIGALRLPNRLVMAPMGSGYADTHHRVTDRMIAYHVARARGGIGLNIVEHSAVHPLGLCADTMPGLWSDEFTPGLKALADAVHEAGGRIAMQLQHGGRQANPDVIGQQCLSASECVAGRDERTAVEMTDEQVWEVVHAFGAAARRVQQAGFDGAEVHLAHGYLGNSFLSPLWNRRDDYWGGDMQRRTHFAKEVLAAIREQCGEEFPVWCRVSAEDYHEAGMHPDEMQKIAPILEYYGFQTIHVSTGSAMAGPSYYIPPGHLLPFAQMVKQVVSVPVIGVGSIVHPQLADEAIAEGICDLIALGRPALADPEYALKAAEDRADDIIPCILCSQGCQERSFSNGMVSCATNPATGREVDWPDWPEGPQPEHPRRVLVAGGGPAGMQAALTAARRGHQVTLCERKERLGGAFLLAGAAPGKEAILALIEYLERQLGKVGVDIRLQTEVTAEMVSSGEFDAVIVATGAHQRDIVRTPGEWHGPFIMADEVLAGRHDGLRAPVAIIGGNVTGTNVAHLLAEEGLECIIFQQGDGLAAGVPAHAHTALLEALDDLGVRVHTSTRVVAAQVGTITAQGPDGEWQYGAGSIVIAIGREPNTALADALADADIEVHVVGDAVEPSHVQAATYSGAEVGRRV